MADWTPPARDRVEGYFKELNNWGRWGPDDQRGTANLITAAKRAQAHSLVRTGRTVSQARDIGPQPAIMYNITFPSNRERAVRTAGRPGRAGERRVCGRSTGRSPASPGR